MDEFVNEEVIVSLVATSSSASTSYLTGWADPVLMDSSKVELLYYGPNSIYLNKNYLPRAWIVHQATELPEAEIDAVKAALASPAFDPAAEAVIEGRLVGPLLPVTGKEPVE